MIIKDKICKLKHNKRLEENIVIFLLIYIFLLVNLELIFVIRNSFEQPNQISFIRGNGEDILSEKAYNSLFKTKPCIAIPDGEYLAVEYNGYLQIIYYGERVFIAGTKSNSNVPARLIKLNDRKSTSFMRYVDEPFATHYLECQESQLNKTPVKAKEDNIHSERNSFYTLVVKDGYGELIHQTGIPAEAKIGTLSADEQISIVDMHLQELLMRKAVG